jgi:hypothetical protein
MLGTASNTRGFAARAHQSKRAARRWRLLSPITASPFAPTTKNRPNSHQNHPPVSSLFSPSFRLFGVDSCQRDATTTRILDDAARPPSPMTSRCRHTCRGTSKPTIVLVVAALNRLCSFSSPPSSTFRPAGPLEARS